MNESANDAPLNENELKALVYLLEDEDEEVSTHVEQRIMSLGGEVIPFLEQQWERNESPRLQARLESIITTLQHDALSSRLRRWIDDGGQDLLRGMWIVATYAYPELRYADLKERVEQLYYNAWLELKSSLHPFDQVKALNGVLFNKMRFMGNAKNFHSPSNSMINEVLRTRKGNPISLCVVYMLVAQKLKMPVYGVNLPNMFILTYKSNEQQFYINAFNRGLIFSKGDIDGYIAQLNIGYQESFYQPCSNLTIVKRVLLNLVVAYDKAGQPDKVNDVKLLLESFKHY